MNVSLRPEDPIPGAAQALSGSVIHLPHLWRAVWRARLWIFLTPLVLVIVIGIWTWLQRPEYEATATLLIEGESNDAGVLAQQVAAFTGMGGDGGSLETDLRLLESRQIAEQVVDSLALQVRVLSPREPRSELFSLVSAGRESLVGRIILSPRPDGRYAVEFARSGPEPEAPVPLPRSVGYGETFEVGGVRLQLSPLEEDEAGEKIELRVLPFRSAVQQFLNQLEVGRGGGAVVEVSLRHPDPMLAASSANSVVARFIDYRRQTNRSDARGAIDFLRDQVHSYEVQLRNAEERLRAFREQETVVSPEQAASSQAQRLSALDAERAELIAERDVLAELVLDVATTAGTEAGTSAYRKLAAFPEFFRNPAVQNILSSLVQLENERADLLIDRTTENRDVQGLTSRIEDLEQQLYRTATNYLASLEEQIAAVERTLARSTGQASRIPEVQTEFLRLTREVELLDQIYTLLQMRLKEQEVSEADMRSNIRPLDAALVPLAPVWPRPKLMMLLALAVGLVLGVAIAIAKAVLDPAMYSKEVAVAAAGGVPILTSIPATRSGGPRLLPAGPAALLRGGAGNHAAGPNGRLAVAAAEAYTDLRTRLTMFTAPPPRVVVVTSPREGDGKSTVAANLALAYAKHGTRTLLLEGDLRRGGLAEQLRLPTGGVGLGQVLSGSATAHEAIVRRELDGSTGSLLDVLLAGDSPRHPTELLDSPALGGLLEELRDRYEMIVVDTPPLDAVADALLLARLADGALLVTRAGATDRDALEEAVAELNAVGTHVHGLVLNGFADRSRARYVYGA